MISWLRRLVPPAPELPLTWRAQWVLHTAARHAQERAAGQAEAGDLIYGLARTDEGVGRTLLANLGLRLDDLVAPGEAPLETTQRPPAPVPMPLAEEAEAVLRLAREEAARVGHRYLGTEHLVLGLLRNRDSAVGRLLQGRGVTLRQARREMARIIEGGA